jgi:hypothetical protein
VPLGEGEVAEQVGLGLGQHLGDRREARPEGVDDDIELAAGRPLVRLLETSRIAEAIMLLALGGTRSWAFRVRWTRQRCQPDPRSCSRRAMKARRGRR